MNRVGFIGVGGSGRHASCLLSVPVDELRICLRCGAVLLRGMHVSLVWRLLSLVRACIFCSGCFLVECTRCQPRGSVSNWVWDGWPLLPNCTRSLCPPWTCGTLSRFVPRAGAQLGTRRLCLWPFSDVMSCSDLLRVGALLLYG